jgi:hypothetical protein
VPPIAWTGSVAYDLRMDHTQGQARTTQHLLTTSLGASSYLYAPWFATVSGGLNLTLNRTNFGADDGMSRDRFTTGTARLDLFPRSRFPFEARVEVNDSRIDGSRFTAIDYRSTIVGIGQRYRPASGAFSLSGTLERRTQQSADFGDDQQDVLTADWSTGTKTTNFGLNLSASRAMRESTDEETLFRSIVAKHKYAPGAELSIETTANWSRTEDDLVSFENDLSIMQWSTIGLWRPYGNGLAFSGSARALALRDDVSGNSVDSAGATLGLTWAIDQNARLSASSTATQVESAGARTRSLTGSVGASYQGDTVDLGDDLRYDWFVSSTFSAARATGQRDRAVGAQVGHSLGHTWQLGGARPTLPADLATPPPDAGGTAPTAASSGPPVDAAASSTESLSLSLSQSLSAARSDSSRDDDEPVRGFDSSRQLTHTGSLTWTTYGGEHTAYGRLSASDSRDLGPARSRFQLLNFQLSGTLQLDRDRSLSGDLTLQRVRQRTAQSIDPLQASVSGLEVGTDVASGELTYRQQRMFGVPRLRFISRLKLAQDVLKQTQTLVLVPERETRLWENRLEYSVGRLQTHVVVRLSQIDGTWRDFIMWRLQRNFGD